MISKSRSHKKYLSKTVSAALPAMIAMLISASLGAVDLGPLPDQQVADKRVAGEEALGCGWEEGFGIGGLDQGVNVLAVYDDGRGPALYAGGYFTAADGAITNNIARWDGSQWEPLSGPSGTGSKISALAVHDDGSGPALYAGGRFDNAGGLACNNIARWDGSSWSALAETSGGLDSSVFSLAVYDDGTGPALYAGGNFQTANGVTVSRIARWDGSAWAELSGPGDTGTDGLVYSLVVWDDGTGPALYAGGSFTNAGGTAASNIARWDGSGWSALASGTSKTVRALAVYDDGSGAALYAAGDFSTAGGIAAELIAKWDGTSWSSLAEASFSGNVLELIQSMTVFDDGSGSALYVGGYYYSVDGMTVNNIARWDGIEWSALSGPSGTGTLGWVDGGINALATFDDGDGADLYAGGFFEIAGGVPANRIARWDGTGWSALSGSSGNGMSDSVGVFYSNSGALYAGGNFSAAGGSLVNNIAQWNGSQWSPLSGPLDVGTSGSVSALTEWDDGTGTALYASGGFWEAGGTFVGQIARWDGNQWSALGGWVFPSVYVLDVYDDGSGSALYAGGSFTSIGSTTVNGIARWNGSAWSALSGPSGTGVNGTVAATAVFDDGTGNALYIGGNFSQAGGVSTQHAARWDGSGWKALSSLPGTVSALDVFDDGNGASLYAGGRLGDFDGFLAKGNGISWTNISVLSSPVSTLEVHDDGSGPALYIGGSFLEIDGTTVRSVARWDGTDWSPLSGPYEAGLRTYADVYSLHSYNDGIGPALMAGGRFEIAGGISSSNIAKWTCDAPSGPTTVASTTHTIGAWSTDSTISVSWSGADTGARGNPLAGYSVLFDTLPGGDPDTAIEVAQTSDPHTVSTTLADSAATYFHLRACDIRQGCSAPVHLGPFAIDSTPPSAVPALTSTSHEVGIVSSDRTIDTTWDAATDNLSGVSGYAYELSSEGSWSCDGIIDTSTLSSTSEMATGSWYWHICAVDTAGNWGPVQSIGPFLLTNQIFADGFESGDTIAWSRSISASPAPNGTLSAK
jgi:hypothetical protein